MEWVKSYKYFIQFKKLLLPCCYQLCLIESTKIWIRVIQYEGECIKNMEWVKPYENYIQSKTITAITLLLPTIFNWIDKTMNDIDALWRWVHLKHVMSLIIQKLHSFKKTALTLLLQTIFDWIEKIMNESDAVWRWVHQKYEMSWFIQKPYSIKKNGITLMVLKMSDWIDKIIKLMTFNTQKVTIIINHLSMHWQKY